MQFHTSQSRHHFARALIAHLYAFLAASLVILWSSVPTESAYAYVDPSVMTYTIQAVAGMVVALSAVLGVAFRRTRRKIMQVFNIDENANKANESAVARIDPDSPNAQELYAAAADSSVTLMEESLGGERAQSVRNLPWRTRFVFALIMCVFMAFIVFIASALEIFGSNTDSLVFSLQNVWWIPVVFCLIAAVIAAGALSLLKGKQFYIALLVIFLLTFAAYVQSLFLNQGMMPADGGFIGWTEPYFIEKMITSGIVWLAILVVPLILCVKHSHRWLQATTVLACAIIIMQLVGVASVAIDSSKTSMADLNRPYVTRGGLLSVSPKDNIVVFVLDTYDTEILDDIIAEDPDYLAPFEDFTYYRNSVGTMIPTTNAVPNMVTDMKPEPGQSIPDYRRTKYEKSTYIDDLCDLGFSVGLYSDSLMMEFDNPADRRIADRTLNVHPVSTAPVDVWRTFIAMEQCALYREAPWVAKPLFWYYTSDVNNRMIADSGDQNLNDSLYELDDVAILNMMRSKGLAVEDESESGAFRFIHLFGPHFPFSVNEDGENVGTNQSDQIAQAKGSMLVVTEYMKQLDELGLYDDATIIVTADHGVWFLTDDPVSRAISPIMLVKTAKSDGSARQPAVVSEAPVCHDDIQPTVIAAAGGDSSRYGITFSEIDDPNRVRYFDALTSAGGNGQRFIEYEINGDALDLSNWKKTGNEWQDG